MSARPQKSTQATSSTRYPMRNEERYCKACHKPAENTNMAEVKSPVADVPRRSAAEEQSQSTSLAALPQQTNIPLNRSRRTYSLPIRGVHDQIGGTNLASSPSLVIRVRNDSTSMASGKANNPSLRLRAKQKQTIAAEVKKTIYVADKQSEPSDAEVEAALDEAQELLGSPKRKAPTEEASPPAKKVCHDKMSAWLCEEDPLRDGIARRIRSHLGLLAADACSDGMYSHPEPLTKRALKAWFEADISDTDSLASLDLRDDRRTRRQSYILAQFFAQRLLMEDGVRIRRYSGGSCYSWMVFRFCWSSYLNHDCEGLRL